MVTHHFEGTQALAKMEDLQRVGIFCNDTAVTKKAEVAENHIANSPTLRSYRGTSCGQHCFSCKSCSLAFTILHALDFKTVQTDRAKQTNKRRTTLKKHTGNVYLRTLTEWITVTAFLETAMRCARRAIWTPTLLGKQCGQRHALTDCENNTLGSRGPTAASFLHRSEITWHLCSCAHGPCHRNLSGPSAGVVCMSLKAEKSKQVRVTEASEKWNFAVWRRKVWVRLFLMHIVSNDATGFGLWFQQANNGSNCVDPFSLGTAAGYTKTRCPKKTTFRDVSRQHVTATF